MLTKNEMRYIAFQHLNFNLKTIYLNDELKNKINQKYFDYSEKRNIVSDEAYYFINKIRFFEDMIDQTKIIFLFRDNYLVDHLFYMVYSSWGDDEYISLPLTTSVHSDNFYECDIQGLYYYIPKFHTERL